MINIEVSAMITTLYSREELSYRSNALTVSMKGAAKPALLPAALQNTTEDQLQISDASRMALQYNVSELDFSGEWTDMQFDVDEDISAQASYKINYAEKFESFKLSFTFSAESLGLSKDDFKAYGGKPIEIRLDFLQQSIEYIRERQMTISQSNRSADEVIVDIAHALQAVLKQKGDKTIGLHLDMEAFQAIVGDAKTSELVDDIAALIGIINNLRLVGGKRDIYDIFVSGKGKPKVDYQEKVDVKIEGSSLSVQITIMPPEESQAELPTQAETEPAIENPETDLPAQA
jgi:hypothetical protein